jgi:hypothetical protein
MGGEVYRVSTTGQAYRSRGRRIDHASGISTMRDHEARGRRHIAEWQACLSTTGQAYQRGASTLTGGRHITEGQVCRQQASMLTGGQTYAGGRHIAHRRKDMRIKGMADVNRGARGWTSRQQGDDKQASAYSCAPNLAQKDVRRCFTHTPPRWPPFLL